VQGARDELLARPRLARDEHARFTGRNRLDLLHQRLPRHAAADDLLEVVLALNLFL
jgi:hypothetical protein